MHAASLLTIAQSVGFNDLGSLVEDVRHVDTDDELSSGFGREHGEDTGTTADLCVKRRGDEADEIFR